MTATATLPVADGRQSSECVIRTENITKTYQRGFFRSKPFQALKGVTLNIEPGQIFGLLGPNGAGKTTLIKVLLGIVRKTTGRATVMGHPAGSMETRRKVGYLPENHRIPRHLTANSAMEYYGRLSGMSMADIRKERPRLLELVGLAGRENDKVAGYSKGMLQRLGLAQSILHRPPLIILDEPTDGVDPVGRKEIRDVLRKLVTEGHTILMNSHLLQEIEMVCDRVAILDRGSLIRVGTVHDLKSEICDAPMQFQLLGSLDAVRRIFVSYPQARIAEITKDAIQVDVPMPDQAAVDAMIDAIRDARLSIFKAARKERTLEEVFMSTVGPNPEI